MNKVVSSYKKTCNIILFVLLSLWFIASFGCGILLREWLDQNAPSIGNAPFGFWMAQQGSIITFVLIIIAYAILMNRADDKNGYKEDND